MKLDDVLQVLADVRRDQVVVSAMSAARQWMQISSHPLDFHYIPSTMGGGFPLALGIAMAQPSRHVIALNGDGCVLMNLGSLVTAAVSGAENFTGMIIDNGNYETTGGQKLASSDSSVSLADFARAARFPTVLQFDSLETWRRDLPSALDTAGPRCIVLSVDSDGDHTLKAPGPMPDRVARFRQALAAPR